jgi:hypothetical protein
MPAAPAWTHTRAASTTLGTRPPREFRIVATLLTFTLRRATRPITAHPCHGVETLKRKACFDCEARSGWGSLRAEGAAQVLRLCSAAVMREVVRAAAFVWMMPALTALASATDAASTSAFASGLPLAIAARAFFTAVRRADRSVLLRAVRTTRWRFRFAAEG